MHMRRWRFTVLLLVALPIHAAGPLKRTFAFDEKSRDALLIVEVAPQDIVEEWQVGLYEYSFELSDRGLAYRGEFGQAHQRI